MYQKPDLLQVMLHYGVEVRDGRTEQLVLCPVHSESQPSCSVNIVKGLWNCKACSAQGDSLTLIMLKEGADFAAAQQFAAERFDSVPGVPARGGRKGLSGGARPARGGYRPTFRRGLGTSS